MKKVFSGFYKLFSVIFVIGVLASIVFLLADHFLYMHKPISKSIDACVFVGTKGGSGSGIAYRNNDKVFIWTCQHVVADSISYLIDIDIQHKTIKQNLQKDRVNIKAKIFNENLEESGYINIWANIIRFSSTDDLAVLEVLEPRVFNQSVHFPKNHKFVPKVGTQVYHVGCMLGWHGYNGCSDGIMGMNGVDLDHNGHIFDKVQCAFHFGSSGGGVFESHTGTCLGLIARSNDRTAMTQGYMIPFRRMVEFAHRLDCMWALTQNEVPENYLQVITDDIANIEVDDFLREMKRLP